MERKDMYAQLTTLKNQVGVIDTWTKVCGLNTKTKVISDKNIKPMLFFFFFLILGGQYCSFIF